MNQNCANYPGVFILATGGTIAGRAASPLETAGYRAGELTIDELLAAVPQLNDIATIGGEQVCNVASPFLTTDTWLKLARRIDEIFREQPQISGIVITHGTDSLEETAYFLNLVVKHKKPVVLVGSMRPATSLSSDGPLNLINAVRVATAVQSVGQGVLVVMNDQIHAAREVSKTHVSHLHTFISPDMGPLGGISSGKISFYHKARRRHTEETEFSVLGTPILPKVDIIYAYLGADGRQIDAAVAAGARGIVLAGMGQGGGTRAQIEALDRAAAAGVVVVRSSRTGSGRILPTPRARLLQGAAPTADNLNPQKARILLALALTVTTDPLIIQDIFGDY